MTTPVKPAEGINAVMNLARTSVLDVNIPREGRPFYPSHWPKNNDGKGNDLPENWHKDPDVIRSYDALQTLQATRHQFVTPDALKTCLDFVFESLPESVQDDVLILEPGWSEYFSMSNEEYENKFPFEGSETTVLDAEKVRDQFVKPYVFWPIDFLADGVHQWLVAVIHLRREHRYGKDGPEEEKSFQVVNAIDVIDPDLRNYDERTDRVYRRLIDILIHATFISPNEEHLVSLNSPGMKKTWVAPSNSIQLQRNEDDKDPERWEEVDVFSSGLRCFNIIQKFLQRLTVSYCYRPLEYDETFFWESLDGWFNPDAVRAEMIGYAAAMVNKYLQYNTRIAIEPVKSISYGNTALNVRDLEPDRKHVRMWIPEVLDKNAEPVMWASPLPSDYNSGDDETVRSEDVLFKPKDFVQYPEAGEGGGTKIIKIDSVDTLKIVTDQDGNYHIHAEGIKMPKKEKVGKSEVKKEEAEPNKGLEDEGRNDNGEGYDGEEEDDGGEEENETSDPPSTLPSTPEVYDEAEDGEYFEKEDADEEARREQLKRKGEWNPPKPTTRSSAKRQKKDDTKDYEK
ncbi:hypothetical protein GGR54DRAFT_601003 [Hypoxylon sp. NC1633]|nr:hypothetical protein GGR54DRAFT_601003 [Hypoxylon sp. NC1633]